jgi:hypothetical protein
MPDQTPGAAGQRNGDRYRTNQLLPPTNEQVRGLEDQIQTLARPE